MREPFKSNFKAKLQTQYNPNDKSSGPVYNSMMNILIDELFKRVELLDLMEIEGVKEEIHQIKFIGTLIGDIKEFKIGQKYVYPIHKNGEIINMVLSVEKG